jgi:hypothetical protein
LSLLLLLTTLPAISISISYHASRPCTGISFLMSRANVTLLMRRRKMAKKVKKPKKVKAPKKALAKKSAVKKRKHKKRSFLDKLPDIFG